MNFVYMNILEIYHKLYLDNKFGYDYGPRYYWILLCRSQQIHTLQFLNGVRYYPNWSYPMDMMSDMCRISDFLKGFEFGYCNIRFEFALFRALVSDNVCTSFS